MRSLTMTVVLSLLCLASLPASTAVAQFLCHDVAPTCGIDLSGYGRGAALVDLDGDGRLDIVAGNGNLEDAFYRQLPDQTFEYANDLWSVAADTGEETWSVLVADFDNDGDPDVFFGVGGYGLPAGNRLLRNDLSTAGVFTDVSGQAGDVGLVSAAFGATALDYNRDGLLDVFLADDDRGTELGLLHLLRNDGGLAFTEVTAAAGLAGFAGSHRHASMGDIDNDGWPDIAVGRADGNNLLLRNNGDGSFTDVAASAGVQWPESSFGMVLEDFDNDGWMDVYLPRYQIDPTGPSRLYLNNADLTFTDVTAGSGMTAQTDMGHNTGDVDGDGYPDIYIGTGSPNDVYDDALFLVTPDGQGGLTATDVSAISGILALGPTRTHGSAFGDYDGDGDIDIYANTGGPSNMPWTVEINRMFENLGNANGWIGVDLEGVLSNRSAVGARSVALTAQGREIHRQLTAGKGFGNTDSPTQHFGLGLDSAVERIDILWPSGIEQTLLAPAAFQRHAVRETGLRLTGTPVIGGSVTLESYGPPLGVSELLLGVTEVELPLPGFGGYLRVQPPFLVPMMPLPLDATGAIALPASLPNDPGLIGVRLLIQSWTHPAGTTVGSTLTNLVELVIQ